jgi:hypothetical protein
MRERWRKKLSRKRRGRPHTSQVRRFGKNDVTLLVAASVLFRDRGLNPAKVERTLRAPGIAAWLRKYGAGAGASSGHVEQDKLQRRYAAKVMLERGRTVLRVSEVLGVHPQAVRAWIARGKPLATP